MAAYRRGRVVRVGPRPAALVAIIMIIAALAGCGGATPVVGGSGDRADDREQAQARQALARWAEAVRTAGGQSFAPIGDLTGQLGDWEPAVGDSAKAALLAGRVTTMVTLPDADPAPAPVTWPDGTSLTVRVMSAEDTLRSLVAAGGPGNCGGCTPLRVVGARLGTARVQTTGGPAQAPTWEFSLQGTSVVITRIAVATGQTVTVTPPPWNATDPPAGLSVEDVTVSTDGTTLTAGFVGAPGPASRPCGADYTARALESDTAVVVMISTRDHSGDDACSAVGARRTATVRLARPLGPRAVLEVRQGLPVTTRSASSVTTGPVSTK